MAIYNWIRHIAAQVPILGSLSNTTAKDHLEAFRQLAVSLAISMAPVYLGALILYIQSAGGYGPYAPRVIIQNGELFMYAAATLSPVIYIVSRDRCDIRAFPSKITFIIVVFVVALISASIFTYERVESQILPTNIIILSISVYVIAVLVFYCALVYNNTFLPNPSTTMREQENDFARKVDRHRGNL